MSELHKLLIEDDASHAHSYVWSVALQGFVNCLEISGDLVGHGDAMPPSAAVQARLLLLWRTRGTRRGVCARGWLGGNAGGDCAATIVVPRLLLCRDCCCAATVVVPRDPR